MIILGEWKKKEKREGELNEKKQHGIASSACWFGLVYLFIYSVTYITLDTSITDYNLQHIL
jgi:hypothetical protein